jgi:ATP-binding cassette, subfamily F, member 3
MSIVFAEGLAKFYGAQDVFANVEFSIARGDKIGLVGPNGAGKTTLLRIILGLEEPNAGNVHRARGLRIGYLSQKPEFPSQQTLHGEMLSVFATLRTQQQALLALADEMAAAEDATEAMQRYAEAERRFDLAGGYTYEDRIARVLSGLSFTPDMYAWPISVLSGGQITRAMLAKLLLQEPDLLVLDEPTNYLDLEALEWLGSYLQAWPHSLLVVSHDRYFLDQVVTRIWDLDHGTLQSYRGNYSAYVVQHAALLERQAREYEEQQEFIAKTEEFVRRYKAGQRTKQARGRETRLNRMERIQAPETDQQMRWSLSTSLRAGDNVLISDEGISIGYESRPDAIAGADGSAEQHVLFRTGAFLVLRGQRVALLGPNGSGKTTFLRTILDQLEPLAGRMRLGASVRVGYLPQTQDWLDADKTIIEQLMDASDLKADQARHLLGRFLFMGDDVFKSVGALSGGERSRLALAILTIRGANFLLLDEPTTHLDIASQEILQKVLVGFNGTILFVSHDRYLADALATHVWVIRDGQLRQFEGNYTSYLQQLEQERTVQVEGVVRGPAAAQERDEKRRRERQEQRAAKKRVERTEALESEIAHLEKQLTTVTGLLDLASASQDIARLQALSREYQQLQATLAERMAEWERWVGTSDDEG